MDGKSEIIVNLSRFEHDRLKFNQESVHIAQAGWRKFDRYGIFNLEAIEKDR